MQSTNPQVIVTNSKSTSSINSSNSTNNNNSIHYNNSTLLHPPPLYYSTSSSNELLLDDNNPKTKYLISSSSSSVSSLIKNQNESNNNNVYVACGNNNNGTKQQNGNTESKYGKIQPINKYMNKYRFFSGKNTSSTHSTTTIDRYNGNTSDSYCVNTATLQDSRYYSRKINNCDGDVVANGPACNSIINDNEISEKSRSGNGNLPVNAVPKVYRNGASTTGLMYGSGRQLHSSPHHHQYQQQQPQVKHLTPNIQSSSTALMQQQQQNGQNKLGYHVINHVSSPESAYSTGYSTDGNSPGKCIFIFLGGWMVWGFE